MIAEKFKEKPDLYYAFSICATWAGIGSLMNGVALTQSLGYVPSAIWMTGNVFACVLFGLIANKIPKVREVFCSKVMMWVCGVMCVFQAWLSMNGVVTVFQDTPIGDSGGKVIAYATAILFLFLLLKFGMIRNVLTDGAGWVIVYALVLGVAGASLWHSKGELNPNIVSGLQSPQAMREGVWKAILLLPGPFTYPYFFEILNYNDKNADGTRRVSNPVKVFAGGGALFGVYMLIAFPLAWVTFTPVLNVVKAILITIIGTSTLSSAMYSIYIAFGNKLGFVVNAFLILFWAVLIPLGVMGMWTLMASVRIYFVGAGILFAICWWLYEKSNRGSASR